MKFKRFMLYLLVIAMLISLSVPVFSDEIIEAEAVAEDTVTDNTGLAEQKQSYELTKREGLAVSLMKGIGVFDKNVDLTADFTRAKLAHAIYVLKDYDILSNSATNIFADIDADTEYVNEISVLYDMGYISGYKGEYRPQDKVTASEMAVVLSRILGLEFVVDMKGGWSVGYMNVAHQYDIFDGVTVSADKAVTTLQAAIIFENLLNAKVEFENTAGVQGYYMTAVLDISSAEGILTDNGITSIDIGDSVNGRIKVGGVTYNSNGINCESYIGKRVKLYYRDVNGDDLYVLAIEDTEKLNTVHINSEDIKDFANRAYEYQAETRTKVAQLASDYNIVYNGRLVTDGTRLTNDKLKPDEGFVELIDQNSDGRYDLVIIEDYVTFVVEEYNSNENVLRSQIKGVSPIDFDAADMDIKILLAADGEVVNVDYQNIAHNGYVLSVARSLDNRAVKIYLAEESISGYVGGLDTLGKSITVDGKEYIASKNINVSIGGSYKLNINHYGHIIWGQRTELVGDKYAYVEKMYFDDAGDGLILKLYTEDNTSLTAPLAPKTVIDGEVYTDSARAAAALQNAVNYVVIFRTNANDAVVKIDTSEPGEKEKADSSLNLLYQNTNTGDGNNVPAFDFSTHSFGDKLYSKYPTDLNTKVFCAKDPYEAGKIYCYTLTDFKKTYAPATDTKIGRGLWLYNTNEDSIIGRAALIKREFLAQYADVGWENNVFKTGIVTKIKLAVNEYNEQEHILTVECDGKEADIRVEYGALTFNSNGENYSISCGDIVRWGINEEGFVDAGNIIVLYDCDRERFDSTLDSTPSYKWQNRWHYLWVYDKEEDYLLSVNQCTAPLENYLPSSNNSGQMPDEEAVPEEPDIGELEETYVDYTAPLNGQPISIWVYDRTHNELREGNLGDIIAYKDVKDETCTKMVARYNSGHRLCIIYK